MSHTTSSNFKVRYQQYLKHQDEPKDDRFYDGASAELDVGLIRSSQKEKMRFRRTAQKLRRYAA